ncbi:2-oxo acid dehydrogenase subunit E2 [Streptomyces actuosus]|uniref:Dihydrolipoamide acetyltransferase component of pyruvate dehydrogenase complex n=1 Tax=Streptomyces actuosus TaxID=1885 RepID=A0ABS2VI56_STRAS|nr:dihydrolipoamide acetyltransferase family protein [Streptomyces actuosus]MBN0042767.1 2-oxo acid dehydrogenase subunit E2 [Streptomyces actuosus]
MAEFTMPSLGADMDEGVLQEWLVAPGDRVGKGDAVAVVETDKAAIEVECFTSGTVGRLLVEPGTRVPVGTPLALIDTAQAPAAQAAEKPTAEARAPGARTTRTRGTGGAGAARKGRAETPAGRAAVHARVRAPKAAAVPEGLPAPEPTEKAAPPPPSAPPSPPPAPAPPSPPSAAGEPAAAVGPLVRHLADGLGVDLGSVHGSGPGGRVTRADVAQAARPAPARRRVTPYARRLARDLGVDLEGVHGTGDGGAVRAADVRAAARAAQAAPERSRPAVPVRARDGGHVPAAEAAAVSGEGARDDGRQREDAMRRAIGELMSRSKREIPHYYLSTVIDLAPAQEWMHRRNRGRPPSARLVTAALLLKAAALAAREVPQLNGHWQDGAFTPGTGVHLGVAVSLRGGGLLTPVIHDADTLTPEDLMATLKDLVRRARQGRLRGSELSGATLTVTSLGEQGVEAVFGVIHPPQVALVGFGAVVERPWAVGGLLGVHPVVTATLSGDHRATDGAIGARYLTAVDRLLHEPGDMPGSTIEERE